MMLLALALAAAAPAPGEETPRAFVERVYAGYRSHDFSPFKLPERWFAPALLAAIEEDARLAQGEVGYLDGDPICQCQDAEGVKATVTNVKVQGRDHARVRVAIALAGYRRGAALALVRTRAGWRIADISSAEGPSLLRALEASNRKQRKK
jgi:hypothetical protein